MEAGEGVDSVRSAPNHPCYEEWRKIVDRSKDKPELIERAKKKTATVGVLQGSITGSASHVVGAIGELIVADLTGATEANTHDYDLVLDGKRIDVKTKKRCNTPPKTYYDCSVAAHGSKQDCDSYVSYASRSTAHVRGSWVK